MLSTRQVLLDRITQERETLFYSVSSMPEDELVRRPLVGEWSAKDILGHVTSWEAEIIHAMEQFMRGEQPSMFDIADVDAWNAVEARTKWDWTWARVNEEMLATRRRLLGFVASLSDDALLRPGPPPEKEPFIQQMLNAVADHDREHWAPLIEHKKAWSAQQQVSLSQPRGS